MPSAAELVLHITGKDDATKIIDGVGKSAGGLGKHLGDVAKIAGGFVLGAGLLKLPGLFSSAVGAASDLNESLSKVNTVFKDQGKEIEQWAAGAAKGFGQSKQQALDAAGSFGNLFTQIGIGTPKAAAMSKQMVELASDFASFHNADITEVITAQTAAFRGEYDALQRFVPTINAAAVEMKALEMTGKKTTKELTIQEKALATHTLMMEGAGEAMGDFDRTNAGLANRTRILSAQFANMKTEIGQALLPVVVKLAGVFLDDVLPVLAQGAAVFQSLAKYIGVVIQDGDTLNDFLADIPEPLRGVAKAIGEVVAKLVEIGPGLATAFIEGLAGLSEFGDWVVSNKAPLVAAITAIGVALLIALGPGALFLVGLASAITLFGVMRSELDTLPEPLLKFRLEVIEGTIALAELADTMVTLGLTHVGLEGPMEGTIAKLEASRQKILEEMGVRETNRQQIQAEGEDRRIAAERGIPYEELLKEMIQDYVNLLGPQGMADEQLQRLIERYNAAVGPTRSASNEIEGLSGVLDRTSGSTGGLSSKLGTLERDLADVEDAAWDAANALRSVGGAGSGGGGGGGGLGGRRPSA